MKIARKKGLKEVKITHNKKLLWIILALVIVLVVLLILIHKGNVIKNNSENSTQIANPASVYCINNSGKLEIRTNDSGQYGVCIINGKECEEWAYFRGECGFTNSASDECSVDGDCVPASCCHPNSCANKNSAPDCVSVKCTMECKLNSLDCGQGSCSCVNKKCAVKLN